MAKAPALQAGHRGFESHRDYMNKIKCFLFGHKWKVYFTYVQCADYKCTVCDKRKKDFMSTYSEKDYGILNFFLI